MAKASSKQAIKAEEVPVTVMTEAEAEKIEAAIEMLKAPEPVEVPEVVTEKVEPIKVVAKKEEPILSNEEKIVAFIESRTGGDTVRLNEFLKSLYPLPQRNEPPLWLNQGTSKQIKVLLSKMQADGLISIVNNTHELLGKFYHAGEQQITQHRNLNNVEILAKK